LIWVTDDLISNTNPLKSLFLRSILRQFDGIFFSSRAQLEVARRWLARESISLEWIPMGVDPAFYPYYDYPTDPFVFSMGTDKHRDPKTLARALATVLDKMPNTEMIVQTNQPHLFPRGIDAVARLDGADVRRCYARSSVIALALRPNVHVSGVTVALEGMSSGRPVVATDNPGLSDYIKDGVTGFLTPPGDSDELAVRLLEVLGNQLMGRDMGVEARTAVESKFNVQNMNKSIASFITSISLVT